MYRCVQGTWTELRPWTNEGKIHLLTDPSSNSFTKYISLVSKYNPRDFTYEGDMLNAFAGLMADLKQRHNLDLRRGLLIQEFSKTPMWTNMSFSVPLKR